MMISRPLHVAALAILAISYPGSAPAEPFKPVLASDGTDAWFPEPIIFHNLSMEAFLFKMSEYRGSSFNRRTTNDFQQASPSIFKRAPVRGESENNAGQQAIVEDLSGQCALRFRDDSLRVVHGKCRDEAHMHWYCNNPDAPTRQHKHTTRPCRSIQRSQRKCSIKTVYNYNGNIANVPYCADIIPIDEKTEEVDVVPTYEGYKTLPDEAWSPGTIDAFYEMAGQFSGLTGHFDYRGHYSSGKEFHSQSPSQSRSWACLGCPSGRLYIETVGFKSEAIGTTYPAGSFS